MFKVGDHVRCIIGYDARPRHDMDLLVGSVYEVEVRVVGSHKSEIVRDGYIKVVGLEQVWLVERFEPFNYLMDGAQEYEDILRGEEIISELLE